MFHSGSFGKISGSFGTIWGSFGTISGSFGKIPGSLKAPTVRRAIVIDHSGSFGAFP